jgi:hypothetical protein
MMFAAVVGHCSSRAAPSLGDAPQPMDGKGFVHRASNAAGVVAEVAGSIGVTCTWLHVPIDRAPFKCSPGPEAHYVLTACSLSRTTNNFRSHPSIHPIRSCCSS